MDEYFRGYIYSIILNRALTSINSKYDVTSIIMSHGLCDRWRQKTWRPNDFTLIRVVINPQKIIELNRLLNRRSVF